MRNNIILFISLLVILLTIVSCQFDEYRYMPPSIKDLHPVSGSMDIPENSSISFIIKTYTSQNVTVSLYISETPSFLNCLPVILKTNSYIPSGGWKPGVLYYWKLKIFDGVEDYISDTFTFKVRNDEIVKITLTSPLQNQSDVDTESPLKWEVSTSIQAPPGFLVYYSKTLESLNSVNPVITYEKSFIPSSGWETQERYYWKIKCFFGAIENVLAESETRSFDTVAKSPSDPSINLLSPENKSDGIPVNSMLSWEATVTNLTEQYSLRDVDFAYDVFYSTSVEGLDIVEPIHTDKTYYIPNTGWNYGTEYFWKIKVYLGQKKSVSAIYSFETEPKPVMSPELSLRSPGNGETNVNIDSPLTFAATGSYLNTSPLFFRIYISDSIEGLDSAIPFITQKKYFFFPGLWESAKRYYWKVEAVQGEFFTVRGPWYFETKNIPIGNVKVNLLSPQYDGENIPTDEYLIWAATPSTNDSVLNYEVYISDDPENIDNVEPIITDEKEYLPVSGWIPDSVYYWKVNASDQYSSAETSIWRFHTAKSTPGYPSITLVLPENHAGGTDTYGKLTWEAQAGITGDELIFYVYIANSMTELDKADPVITDETEYIPEGGWKNSAKYYWKVVVHENGKTVSSEVRDFTTKDIDPGYPSITLVSPENHTSEMETNEKLTWEAQAGIAGDELIFYVYIANSMTELDKTDPVITDKTEYIPEGGWKNSAKYYWKVVVHENGKTVSSEVRDFTTKDIDPGYPSITLVSPENHTSEMETNEKLTWEAQAGIAGDELIFYVYIANSMTELDKADPVITDETEYIPEGGWKNSAKYYWKVVVHENGKTVSSEVRDFTTKDIDPGYPSITLVSPENHTSEMETNEKLTWEAQAGIAGDELIFYVYIANSMTELDKTDPVITDKTEYIPEGGWKNSAKYYWKVVVHENGKTVSSEVRDFTTKDIDPGYPEISLVFPSDDSVNVRIDSTFTWNATPADTGDTELKYEFYLYESGINVPVITTVSEKKCKPYKNLEENREYSWKVRAIQGSVFSESTIWNFKTGSGLDFEVKINSPSNGSVNVGLTENLTWNATKSSLVEAEPFFLVYISDNPEHLDYVIPINTNDKYLEPLNGKWNGNTTYYWKLEGHNGIYISFDGPASFTTCAEINPVPRIKVLNPSPGEENVELFDKLRWDLVSEEIPGNLEARSSDIFNIFISKSEAGLYITAPATTLIDKFEYIPSAGWEKSEEYFYRIKLSSNPETEDATGSFKTRSGIYELPQIVLISPVNGATDTSLDCALQWEATESYCRASGHLEYTVMVADSVSDLNNASLTVFATTNVTQYMSSTLWAPYSNYVWEVEARYFVDGIVQASDTAGPFTFNTTGLAPSEISANPKYPSDGQTDVSVYPELDWSIVPDSTTSTPTYYEVYIGETSNPDILAATTTFTSYAPSALSTGTTYYWAVRGVNQSGQSVSPIWSFTTQNRKNSYTTALDIHGDRVFAAQGERGLAIYDVPSVATAALLERNVIDLDYPVYGVTYSDQKLIADLGEAGVKIIDITDILNPVTLSEFDTAGFAIQTIRKDDYLFTADGFNGIITDISNIGSPSFVNYVDPSHEASGSVMDLHNDGNILFAADGETGVTVFDITDIESPVVKSNIDLYASTNVDTLGVSYKNGYVYCVSASHNEDDTVTDDGKYGLSVIDLSNPGSPSLTATLTTSGFARDIFILGDYVYVADGKKGFAIIDISLPAAPVLISETDNSPDNLYEFNGIRVQNDKVFIAAGDGGIIVFDISDKSNPYKIH